MTTTLAPTPVWMLWTVALIRPGTRARRRTRVLIMTPGRRTPQDPRTPARPTTPAPGEYDRSIEDITLRPGNEVHYPQMSLTNVRAATDGAFTVNIQTFSTPRTIPGRAIDLQVSRDASGATLSWSRGVDDSATHCQVEVLDAADQPIASIDTAGLVATMLVPLARISHQNSSEPKEAQCWRGRAEVRGVTTCRDPSSEPNEHGRASAVDPKVEPDGGEKSGLGTLGAGVSPRVRARGDVIVGNWSRIIALP